MPVTPAEANALRHQIRDLEEALALLRGDLSALRRQNEHLGALYETSLGLIDRLDKEELLEAILQRAAHLTGTAHGYIYLLEPGAAAMQMRVGMGFFKGQIGLRVAPGQGLGGKVWQSERFLRVDDYRVWSGRLAGPSFDSPEFVASALSNPLHAAIFWGYVIVALALGTVQMVRRDAD